MITTMLSPCILYLVSSLRKQVDPILAGSSCRGTTQQLLLLHTCHLHLGTCHLHLGSRQLHLGSRQLDAALGSAQPVVPHLTFLQS